MFDIPRWIGRALKQEEVRCHECKMSFNIKNISAIGIRDSLENDGNKKNNKECLFIELVCSRCSRMTLFELKKMSLIEFTFDLLDEQEKQVEENLHDVQKNDLSLEFNFDITEKMNNIDYSGLFKGSNKGKKRPIRKRKKKKSKITLLDIKEIKEFLKSIKYHEEFLVAIGLSPEEIDKYNIKKRKKDK